MEIVNASVLASDDRGGEGRKVGRWVGYQAGNIAISNIKPLTYSWMQYSIVKK